MNGLSRDARALIERARNLHEPSAGDRSVVRQALALKLPAVLATAIVAQSAPAAASVAAAGVRVALVGKWLIGGALLGTLSVGAIELQTRSGTDELSGGGAEQRRTPRLQPSPAASERLAPERHRDLEAASPVEVPTKADARGTDAVIRQDTTAGAARGPIRSEEAATGRSQRATVADAPTSTDGAETHVGGVEADIGGAEAHIRGAEAATPGVGASGGSLLGSTDADQLLLEARALRQAQAALREGQAARALELIERQASAFRAGALNEERNAVRLVALCALGRASRAEIDRFLETSGSSPLAARVRSACADER